MLKFRLHCKRLGVLCAFLLILGQYPCFPQSGSETPIQEAHAEGQAPPDLLKELEAMKKRIEQLEAELKNRTAQEHPSAGVPREPKTPLTLPTAPEERPAPFAFGDFTWLNGNPRNKESVLDSKYFTGEFRIRHQLHLRLQPSYRPHPQRNHRGRRTGEFQVQTSRDRRRLPRW